MGIFITIILIILAIVIGGTTYAYHVEVFSEYFETMKEVEDKVQEMKDAGFSILSAKVRESDSSYRKYKLIVNYLPKNMLEKPPKPPKIDQK